MTQFQKIALFVSRISIGWYFFYAGWTKLAAPSWSAEGYLKGAKFLSPLYQWFANPSILPAVNFFNEWGLTLIGLALILGLAVRFSSILAIVMMLLYYFAAPDFPYAGHGFIVDDHIIYIGTFLVLAAWRAGRVWGLENWCANLPICASYPKLRALLG